MSGTSAGLTWRSLLLGLVLAAGLAAVTPYNDCVVGNSYIAGNHLPAGALFVLLLLSALNLAYWRIRGRAMLSGREMAVIYVLIMVTSGIASFGLLRYLLPVCTIPYYYANVGNRWEDLIWGHTPSWLAVSDKRAVYWFWEGMPEGAHVPWDQWTAVLWNWFVFVGALWVMMICLAVLIRKQWVDRERLAFPLVQVPYEVLRPALDDRPAGFFANRLLWIGAGGVFLIHLLNGLHQYFPALPQIATSHNLNSFLADRPWNAAYPLFLGIFFSTIGVAYLLSLEVAAGFWFSVLLIKAQSVLLATLGYEGDAWTGTIAEMTDHEQMGALLVMAAMLMWTLRGAFRDAFRKAFLNAPDVDDTKEAIGYRPAVFALLGSLIVAIIWLLRAGMTVTAASSFMLVFLAICLVLTRIIAEAGMLMVHVSFYPGSYLLLAGGAPALGARNLTVLTFVDSTLTFDLREFLMPSALNSLRLAEQCGVPTRRLTLWIGLALVFVLAVATPIFLTLVYRRGGAEIEHVAYLSALPRRFFASLGNNLENPGSASGRQYVFVAIGGSLVTTLAWLRVHFVWWPIHPLGLVMASSYASLNLWFSLFLGWLAKLVTIRYGGLSGYTKMRPLFVGLIVGDLAGGVLWTVVGFFTGVGIRVTLD